MKSINKRWMTFPIFLVISFFLFSFVNQHNDKKNILPEQHDSLKTNQPKIDVKVNKKYDESGNLIQYDSSYSIIYNMPGNDFQFNNIENDSIFAELKNRMKANSLFNNDDFFNGFPEMNFQNMNAMENLKQMQEMINKMFPNMRNDSLIINPQQNNEPRKEEKPANMITL